MRATAALVITLALCACTTSVEDQWQAARAKDTESAYLGFRNSFPRSPQAALATRRITELRAGDQWESVLESPTEGRFERFISEYPESEFVPEAKRRIQEIQDARAAEKNAPEPSAAIDLTGEAGGALLAKWEDENPVPPEFRGLMRDVEERIREEYKQLMAPFEETVRHQGGIASAAMERGRELRERASELNLQAANLEGQAARTYSKQAVYNSAGNQVGTIDNSAEVAARLRAEARQARNQADNFTAEARAAEAEASGPHSLMVAAKAEITKLRVQRREAITAEWVKIREAMKIEQERMKEEATAEERPEAEP